MTDARASAALLALIPLLGVGGCSVATPRAPAEASVSTGAADAGQSADLTERVEVSGSAGPERIAAYQAMTVTALEQVEDLWGQGAVRWSVRVELPATAAEFEELTGAAPGAQVPATTVGSMGQAHIVVHPDSWDLLTPQGRQAVLTHEVTHLSQQGDGSVPRWLGEGLAEYTAHRDSDLPPATIAGSALEDVRAGSVPTTWPDPTTRSRGTDPATRSRGTDPTTRPRGTDPAWRDYALSWLACRYIAETWSEEALLELSAAVAGGLTVKEAMPEVLGTTETNALAGWGVWLREIAG